jgi:tRNA-splicing ligase RtcB
MSDRNYNLIQPENGVPIKARTRTKGVAIEAVAEKQLRNVAAMPFIYKWVAGLPDVHWGIGATVGSVIPTKGTIIPTFPSSDAYHRRRI